MGPRRLNVLGTPPLIHVLNDPSSIRSAGLVFTRCVNGIGNCLPSLFHSGKRKLLGRSQTLRYNNLEINKYAYETRLWLVDVFARLQLASTRPAFESTVYRESGETITNIISAINWIPRYVHISQCFRQSFYGTPLIGYCSSLNNYKFPSRYPESLDYYGNQGAPWPISAALGCFSARRRYKLTGII